MSRVDEITRIIQTAETKASAGTGGIPRETVLPKVNAEATQIVQNTIAELKAQQEETAARKAAQVKRLANPVNAREEQIALKKAPETTKQKAFNAQKTYDDYTQSAEYKTKAVEREKQKTMYRLLSGIVDIPMPEEADEKEQQLKAEADYWQSQYEAEENQRIRDADMKEIESWSDEDRAALEEYVRGRDVRDDPLTVSNPLRYIFQTHKAAKPYAALAEKYGEERLKELAESYSRVLHEQDAQKIVEDTTAAVDTIPGAVGHNILSVGANGIGGVLGTLGRVNEAFNRTGRYQTLEAYTPGDALNLYAGTVRGATAQNVQGEDGGAGRKALSVGYQGLMSVADTIARGYLGGGAFGGAALAATNTFSQTMADAAKQGASPGWAALLATSNAAIEALSEKIPLDNLISTAKGGKQTVKQIVKTALAQAGIEATTEEISLVGNLLAEAAILREKSSYNQTINELVANGATPAEAKQQAAMNIWNEAVNTALVSAVSGGLSSAGASVVANMGTAPETAQPQATEAERIKQNVLNAVKSKENAVTPEMAQKPQAASQTEETVQPEQVPTQQKTPAQVPVQQETATVNDAIKKTMEQLRGAKNQTATNSMAERILSDPEAVRQIQEQTGVEVTGTKAEQRKAVKEALNQIANEQTQQPQMQTGSAPIQEQANEEPQSMPTVDTQKQSIEGGRQIKGTGAAEQNFSGVAEYENMLYDGNIQRERLDAVRNVEMPKKDNDGRRVTEFAGNAVSAGVTPDRMADAIKSLVGDKQLSFDTRTNRQSLENAASEINAKGEQTVISELATNAANKTIADGDVEKGLVLYAKYANDPDYQETASAIFTDLAAVANMAGRDLQLFSLLKRMTPEGQLMAVRKSIGKTIEKINESRSGRKQIVYNPGKGNLEAAKGVAQKRNVQIDEALEQAFLDAKTEDQKKSALDDIYKNVAAQIKPTLGEAWDAWRNLAMLGNLKTHERNFGSTAAFQPYASVKRAIGTVLENVFVEQKKRTKSVLGTGKEAKKLLSWAKEDARSENVNNLLGGTSSAGDEARSAIQDYRKILPGVLDSARKKNLDLMEREDRFFKRGEYARSLAAFLKARGYTAEQLQNEAVPRGVLGEARQYAIREAQKATFNDRNEFSDKISKLSKTIDNFGPVAKIVRKGILPFVKTPANVVKRAMEYNPVSMANTLIHAKGDIDSGRKSAADVIDEVSAGLTGTAAMALGAALAAGLVPGVELVGAVDDEDELREGAQEYSIGIGGKYYSVAWLAPAMIPLFIGANLYHTFSNWDDDMDGWDLAKAIFFDITVEAINPMLELSMLSSLNDFVDNISNEETAGDKVMAAFVGAASSYFIQGLPTLAGQFEQATETEKNVTYVNTDNELERAVKKTIADATKRVPIVDLYQTQKLDEWGQPVNHEGGFIERFADALVNPFSVTTRKTDPLTKEITRLNKVQETNVTPPYVSKVITYTDKDGNVHDGERLTEDQYQTLATTQGQTAKRILETMFSSKDYAAMTDEQKAKAENLVYDYAKEKGCFEAIEGYPDMKGWKIGIDGKEADTIIRKAAADSLTSALSDIGNAWTEGWSTEQYNKTLETAYSAFEKMGRQTQNAILKDASTNVRNYIEARQAGISQEKYLDVTKKVIEIKPEGEYKNANQKQIAETVTRFPGLTKEQEKLVLKMYMSDAQDKNIDDLEAMGYDTDDFAYLYRTYWDYTSGEGKKKRTAQKWMKDYDIDYAAAKALYEIFSG